MQFASRSCLWSWSHRA